MMIPHKIHPWTKQPNNRWAGEIAGMREKLSQRNAALVYFNGAERLWYLPSENELKTNLPLQIMKTATDGRIYSFKNVAASSQKR